jgi:capsular polysaccharide biosynthesis protein
MNTTPAMPPALPPYNPSGAARADQPRFPVLLLFIVWLAIVLVTTLVTFILPEYFVSTTRIKIGTDDPDLPAGQTMRTNAIDPHYLPTEFEIIQSEAVLGRVIDKLNLNEVWGRKFMDGGTLKTSETLALLRGRLDFRPVRNTSLLDIRAFSENPAEARDLANEVALTYQAWRQERVRETVIGGLRSLEELAQAQDQRIALTKQRLAELAEASNATQKSAASDLQAELEDLVSLRRELIHRIELEKVNLHLPRSGQVIILERAVASAKPFRPNKTLNIMLGITFGALAGFLLALLVYAIRHWAHHRRAGDAGTNTVRGLRTFLQVSVALLVGALVGYNCAMPLSPATFVFIFLFIILGALAIGYVAIVRTTPLPPKPNEPLASIPQP